MNISTHKMDIYVKLIETYLAPAYDIISKLGHDINNTIPSTLEKYLKRPIKNSTIRYEEYDNIRGEVITTSSGEKIIIKFGFDYSSILVGRISKIKNSDCHDIVMFHFIDNVLCVSPINSGGHIFKNSGSHTEIEEELRLMFCSLELAEHMMFLLEETYGIDLGKYYNSSVITDNVKMKLLYYYLQ